MGDYGNTPRVLPYGLSNAVEVSFREEIGPYHPVRSRFDRIHTGQGHTGIGGAKKVDLIRLFTSEVEIDSETLMFLVIRNDHVLSTDLYIDQAVVRAHKLLGISDVIVIQVKTPDQCFIGQMALNYVRY